MSAEQDTYSLLGFNLLNFTNFEQKLKNLPGFDGFSPRYTLIGKIRAVKDDPSLARNTSAIVMIVVCSIIEN